MDLSDPQVPEDQFDRSPQQRLVGPKDRTIPSIRLARAALVPRSFQLVPESPSEGYHWVHRCQVPNPDLRLAQCSWMPGFRRKGQR